MSNIFDLDTGSNAQQTLTYLGPSLDWALLPVQPELIVTTSGPLCLAPTPAECCWASQGLRQSLCPAVSRGCRRKVRMAWCRTSRDLIAQSGSKIMRTAPRL